MSSVQLDKIYLNPEDPGSLGGVEGLYQRARQKGVEGLSRKVVIDYLASRDAYTLHKQVRKRFRRNKILVGTIDKQWQADLADLNVVQKENDNSRYLLTVIDCLSKYAWVEPLRTKGAADMADAWRRVLARAAPRKPEKVQTDKGTEFFNTQVQKLFTENNIHLFASESDQKAAIVERFNRTLKAKMWRYFTASDTRRYLNVLQQLVSSYNHSKHRTIGMAPIQVNKNNELQVWRRLAGDEITRGSDRRKTQVHPGDTVRISKSKHTFEKGYEPNWTTEYFNVIDAVPTGRRVYKLQDIETEPITGVFYKEEVQKIAPKTGHEGYKIEKVLKVVGKKALIKWKGWPNKFNSWIQTKNIKNYGPK